MINANEDLVIHARNARELMHARAVTQLPFLRFFPHSLACSLSRSIESRSFNLTYVLNFQQSSLVEDCFFKEHHNTNGYSSFESKPHAGWFLALTNDGRAKPGSKAVSGQRAVEFLSRRV